MADLKLDLSINRTGKFLLHDGKTLTPLKSGLLNKFKPQPGEHYRVLDIRKPGNPLADDLIALRAGDDLSLALADGTRVMLDGYFTQCKAGNCKLSLPTFEDKEILFDDSAGRGPVLADGSTLVYFHGERETLKHIALADHKLHAVLSGTRGLEIGFNAGSDAEVSALMGGPSWAWGLPGLGVVGAGGGGGAGSAAAAADNIVSGNIVAGPVIGGNGLTVKLYKADGTTLLGSGAVSDTGGFRINVGSYSGVVIAKVEDTSAGDDFIDEATGAAKDLSANLMAVGVAGGGTVTLNINPLTTVAAIKAGAVFGGISSAALDTVQVTQTNQAIAKAFGLTDLHDSNIIPTINTAGGPNSQFTAGAPTPAEKYGALLAALSGADTSNAGNMQATIDALANGITLAGSLATLDSAATQALIQGAGLAAHNTQGSGANDLTRIISDLTAKTDALISINPVSEDNIISAAEQSIAITGTTTTGASVTLTLGGRQKSATVTGANWSYTLTADDIAAMGQGGETLQAAADPGGRSAGASRSVVIDTLGPSVTSINLSTTNPLHNPLKQGDRVDITVNLGEPTKITGTPQLTLDVGGTTLQAGYVSGGGTRTLIFSCTIPAGVEDANGISIPQNGLSAAGATLTDRVGNNAVLAHTAVNDNAGFKVDSRPPTLATTGYSAAENTTAIATLAATDAGEVSFELTGAGADNALFRVTRNGVLSLRTPKDFEAPGSAAGTNTYALSLGMTDAAGNTTGQAISVSITNAADAPVITGGTPAPSIIERTDAPGSLDTPYSLLIGQSVSGFIATPTDKDYFRIQLEAGKTYQFAMVGTGTDYLASTLLGLRDAGGNFIKGDDNYLTNSSTFSKVNEASFSWTANNTGTYYLIASSSHQAGTGAYGITFSDAAKPSYDVAMGAGRIDFNGSWAVHPGTATTLTYGFRDTWNQDYPNQSDLSTFARLNQSEMALARESLKLWSDLCSITFTELNPGGYTNDATMLFGCYTDPNDGKGAFAQFPPAAGAIETPSNGDVWLNRGTSFATLPQPGSHNFRSVFHEIGHALGLSHPGPYNASSEAGTEYSIDAKFVQDSNQYSVMSYFAGAETGASFRGKWPVTPMLLDIAAIQNMYGANYHTRDTDTIYGFGSNAGSLYTFEAGKTAPVYCIWDGGGNDTIDASLYTHDQLIDLTPGGFSNIAGSRENISIAFGATIENAIGGSGNDILIGNDADNTLRGGPDDDLLIGGYGMDTAVVGFTRAQCSYEPTIDGWKLTTPNGQDDLREIEQIKFSDQTVALPQVSTTHWRFTTVSFEENNTIPAYSIRARDDDSSPTGLSYSLSGPDAALFNLDAVTGDIRFKDAPDFENPQDGNHDNLYLVEVRASDGVLSSDPQLVAIAVTDNTPQISAAKNETFAENGTGVAVNAQASHLDGEEVIYQLSGEDAGLFNIDQATGSVTFITPPDFENPLDQGHNNIYEFLVRVRDLHDTSRSVTSKGFYLSVTNLVTEAAPSNADSAENADPVALGLSLNSPVSSAEPGHDLLPPLL